MYVRTCESLKYSLTYLLLILLIPDNTYHLMPQSQSNNNNTTCNNPHNNLARTRPGTEKEMSVGITII